VLPWRDQWNMCSCFGATLTNLSAVRKCVVDLCRLVVFVGSITSSCGHLLVGLLWWKWTELTPFVFRKPAAQVSGTTSYLYMWLLKWTASYHHTIHHFEIWVSYLTI